MNRLRRLSIRWRITIGSVLVAAVLLAGAAIAFRSQIEQAQTNSDKKLLYGASTPYIAQIRDHPTRIDRPAGEEHVAVVNPEGNVVASNLPDELTDRIGTLRQLGSGSHFLEIARAHYLVTVEKVKTPAGDWRIVATRDQRATEQVLGNLTNILLVGATLLLVGFGAASWLLTTAALRPVARMRRRAEELRATGSPEPLPVGPARDELADLATTLNAFISSVQVTAARERQMVSDASHELRTPLAVLKTQLELAHLSEGDPEALRRDLGLAEDSVDRLSSLATSLLELSALESDFTVGAAPWSVLVAEFVAASDRARVLGLRKNLAVQFDVDEGEGDADFAVSARHFGQIIDNLISNAVRAVPSGGAVTVGLRRGGANLELVVEDSGPGMPEDFIGVAFDRFTRPDEQRGESGGSGLGLSIVSAIVAKASGTISLSNGPESGLRVEILLPSIPAATDRMAT